MKVKRLLIYLALSAGAFVALYPFLWMAGAALKTHSEATTATLAFWPQSPQWQNIPETFSAAPFARYFFNTFFVSLTVCFFVCLTAIMAGYAFARLRFCGRSLLFALTLSSMMVPFEVMFIPNYVLITKLDWYNTYAALIVPWCANAFSIFLMRQAFLALPNDYYDAAVVDGCGHLRFLAKIATPLVKPMLITVALFAFLGSYNALLWPLIVTSSEAMRVVQVGLTLFYSDAGLKLNLLMCASMIVIMPSLLLYFVAQRYFVESAVSAGIKG